MNFQRKIRINQLNIMQKIARGGAKVTKRIPVPLPITGSLITNAYQLENRKLELIKKTHDISYIVYDKKISGLVNAMIDYNNNLDYRLYWLGEEIDMDKAAIPRKGMDLDKATREMLEECPNRIKLMYAKFTNMCWWDGQSIVCYQRKNAYNFNGLIEYFDIKDFKSDPKGVACILCLQYMRR